MKLSAVYPRENECNCRKINNGCTPQHRHPEIMDTSHTAKPHILPNFTKIFTAPLSVAIRKKVR